jgi:hypothetical protein
MASTSVKDALHRERCQFRIAPPQRRVVNRKLQVPRLLFVLVASDKDSIKPSDFSYRDADFSRNDAERKKRKQQRLESGGADARPPPEENLKKQGPRDGGDRVWVKVLVYDDTTLREILEASLVDEYAAELLLGDDPSAAAPKSKSEDVKAALQGAAAGCIPTAKSVNSTARSVEMFHVFPGSDAKPNMESLGRLSLTLPSATKVDMLSISELSDPKVSEFRGGDMIAICGVSEK